MTVYQNLSSWRLADLAVNRILPVEIPQHWLQLQSYLDRTPQMWENGLTREMFLAKLLSGNLQLWILTEGKQVLMYATTQVRTFDMQVIVVVTWLAGRKITGEKTLHFLLDCLHRYAAYNQAFQVRVEGRKGWTRLLTRLGFFQPYVVLAAPINRERMN
jgi:hypothetical protein